MWTPLRGDFPSVLPLPGEPDGPIVDRVPLAVADLFASLSIDGAVKTEVRFGHAWPRDGLALEIGLRPVGLSETRAFWRTRAEAVVFEAAIFPASRAIPLMALVVVAARFDDKAPRTLGDDERGRLAALGGSELVSMKSAPKEPRALRGIKKGPPEGAPTVVIGRFEELGARVPADLWGEHGDRGFWLTLSKHQGQSTIFNAIPEGPMAQAAVDGLSAALNAVLGEASSTLHDALGPDRGIAWGFHASATFPELVGAFERDGFIPRPLPPLAGAPR
ncbi:MAG: hypothetical protein H6711_33375 [Myxococcales bacterium]|nr:hypothetical protein [Myxococcales bacterium]